MPGHHTRLVGCGSPQQIFIISCPGMQAKYRKEPFGQQPSTIGGQHVAGFRNVQKYWYPGGQSFSAGVPPYEPPHGSGIPTIAPPFQHEPVHGVAIAPDGHSLNTSIVSAESPRHKGRCESA